MVLTALTDPLVSSGYCLGAQQINRKKKNPGPPAPERRAQTIKGKKKVNEINERVEEKTPGGGDYSLAPQNNITILVVRHLKTVTFP